VKGLEGKSILKSAVEDLLPHSIIARSRDNSNRIWKLLNLELWFRVFVDGESFSAGKV